MRRGLAFFGTFFTLMAVCVSSFATSPDPTGGLFTSGQDDLTTIIIPAAAGIVLIAIVFWLAVRYFSKSVKKG